MRFIRHVIRERQHLSQTLDTLQQDLAMTKKGDCHVSDASKWFSISQQPVALPWLRE